MQPTVKVYQGYVDCLENQGNYDAAYASMPTDRKKKISRYPMQKDRRLSCGAWLALRWALSHEGVDVADGSFFRGPLGKPHLVGKSANFSLSHSSTSVLCAVSDQINVGCDVQLMTDFNNYNNSVLHACMTPEERSRIAESEPGKQASSFFRRWAIKESYLKMRGTGINDDLRSLCVHLEGNPTIHDASTGKKLPCAIAEYFLEDGSCYAICADAEHANFELTKDAVSSALEQLTCSASSR